MKSHNLNPASTKYVWNTIWRADRYGDSSERVRRARMRLECFELKHWSANSRFLDLGCGTGDMARNLEMIASEVVGMDRSEIALGLAMERSDKSRVLYVCAEATQIPFASSSFDAVGLFGLLEHVRDHSSVVSEVHRVLRPGGRLFLSSSNANSSLQLKNRCLDFFGLYRYGFQRNWRLKDLFQVLSGFEVNRSFVVQTDKDMPVIRLVDMFLAMFISDWGRYICLEATKGGGR